MRYAVTAPPADYSKYDHYFERLVPVQELVNKLVKYGLTASEQDAYAMRLVELQSETEKSGINAGLIYEYSERLEGDTTATDAIAQRYSEPAKACAAVFAEAMMRHGVDLGALLDASKLIFGRYTAHVAMRALFNATDKQTVFDRLFKLMDKQTTFSDEQLGVLQRICKIDVPSCAAEEKPSLKK